MRKNYYIIQYKEKHNNYLRDINYHLPEWVKILKEIYFDSFEKEKNKNSYHNKRTFSS
ncbi:MAG: hypothetical protein QXO21_05465 [Candidatus Anstonellales archaeon]